MRIRDLTAEDIHAVMAIQDICPQAARWSGPDYKFMAETPGSFVLVAEAEWEGAARVVGFAAFHRVMDEAEVLNLAVAPAHQRRGIARALLEAARRRLQQAGAKRVFLEVRAANQPALGLYFSLGFTLHSRRKNYYHDPEDDACVLWLELAPPGRTWERY
jgi:ribosomal-protein-alanine N-acetyltransferase